MPPARKPPQDIDAYIAASRVDVQPILQKIRETIRKAAPEAVERISYQIPTFALEGNLVHFAAFNAHIGFYPPVRSDAKLMQELAPYAGDKGNLRFPLDQPIPYGLIRRIVKCRIRENRAAAEARRNKR